MLRFDSTVFGPVHSRRLGRSLGINLLPRHGKLCNFDCIYCECGWNGDGRSKEPLPSADEVAAALETRLRELKQSGGTVDSITFSGNGEPTLHPQFAQIVDMTVALAGKYFSDAVVSVLSNGTTLHRDEIVEALKKTSNPILKLDAPFDSLVSIVNRPQGGYHVDEVVENMKKFDGAFILQTMMLGSPEFDFRTDGNALSAWKDIVRKLRPRVVMVYSLDRPAPQQGLEKLSRAQMQEMLSDLMDEGINIKIY